ncbi:MAG TPA: hypothetical protein VEP30_01080 [Chthoniobacterales bacterium]|nr:hypothetical protein [Chthoniobacterales bacterium]
MNAFSQTIISALTLLGVGGVVGGYITYLLDKKNAREFNVLEQKERRYRSCLLYMDAFFEPKNIKYLSSRQPDIDEASDVIEYLKMEFFEMTLYASKEVIFAVKGFIEQPNRENFPKSILAMRRDLGATFSLYLNDNPRTDLTYRTAKAVANGRVRVSRAYAGPDALVATTSGRVSRARRFALSSMCV